MKLAELLYYTNAIESSPIFQLEKHISFCNTDNYNMTIVIVGYGHVRHQYNFTQYPIEVVIYLTHTLSLLINRN